MQYKINFNYNKLFYLRQSVLSYILIHKKLNSVVVCFIKNLKNIHPTFLMKLKSQPRYWFDLLYYNETESGQVKTLKLKQVPALLHL